MSLAKRWLGLVRAPRSPHRKFMWNSVRNSSKRIGSNIGPREDISCTTVRAFRLNMSTCWGKCLAASRWAAVASKSKSRLFMRLLGKESSGCSRPPPSPSVTYNKFMCKYLMYQDSAVGCRLFRRLKIKCSEHLELQFKCKLIKW